MTLPCWLTEQEKAICQYLIACEEFVHFYDLGSPLSEEYFSRNLMCFHLRFDDVLLYWTDAVDEFSSLTVIINGCCLIHSLPIQKKRLAAIYRAILLKRRIKNLIKNWDAIRMKPHKQLAFC